MVGQVTKATDGSIGSICMQRVKTDGEPVVGALTIELLALKTLIKRIMGLIHRYLLILAR